MLAKSLTSQVIEKCSDSDPIRRSRRCARHYRASAFEAAYTFKPFFNDLQAPLDSLQDAAPVSWHRSAPSAGGRASVAAHKAIETHQHREIAMKHLLARAGFLKKLAARIHPLC